MNWCSGMVILDGTMSDVTPPPRSDVEVNIKGDAAKALNQPAAFQNDAAGDAMAAADAEKTEVGVVEQEVQSEPKKAAATVDDKEEASEAPKNESAPMTVNTTEGAWNEVQELALVKALKTFGKDLGQERWVRIAEAVPGKNKVECFKHFKELRDGFRAKKADA